MTVQPDVGQPRPSEPEDFPETVVGNGQLRRLSGQAAVSGQTGFLGKPVPRGWIHVYAAIVAVIARAALVSVSWRWTPPGRNRR